jgi:hypothetical protein
MQIVAAPLQVPKAASLIDSVGATTPDDNRWIEGICFEPDHCDASQRHNPCDGDTLDPAPPCPDAVCFTPSEIVGSFRSSTLGWEGRDGQARAANSLALCRSAHIENELWTGDETGSPSFEDLLVLGGTDLSAGGLTLFDPVDALKILIGFISPCGCGTRKVIHASPRVVAEWMDGTFPLIERRGRALYTFEDHIVVAGAGYPGTGPGGVDLPGDSEYVYATGGVEVLVSAPRSIGTTAAQRVNARENEIGYQEKSYATAYFDPNCCFAGIGVTLVATSEPAAPLEIQDAPPSTLSGGGALTGAAVAS